MNLCLVTSLATLLLAASGSTVAIAQTDWPAAKPVTLIVPSSPGGGTDAYGRILAQALTEQLKQSFVVDNKPGASGAIGATAAAKAEPNGYTILVASNSSLGINPMLMKN
ncbi:MAG TPA: tripartite tricarboxylate transporter substrate-binding protein, partial [Burkholderiaceae bacterium]